MTPLEIILIVMLWVTYGVLSAYQDKGFWADDGAKYIVYIIISPILLIYRVIIGIFHPKSIN
jgi:hypothetical protein